jgi:hypothetical protein
MSGISNRNAGGGGGGTPSDTVVSSKVSNQAAAAGVATEYSRGDHVHGSLNKSTTVVGPGTFGSSPVVGASTVEFAPKDHFHGLPVITPADISGGSPGIISFSVVCEVTCVGAVLTVKNRTLTFNNGILTSSGVCV